MKTAEELYNELISYIEAKTGDPFPTEPLFLISAKDAANLAYNTIVDGQALQLTKPMEHLLPYMATGCLNQIRTLLQQSVESQNQAKLNYNNISLSDLRPKAEQLLYLVSELERQCLD